MTTTNIIVISGGFDPIHSGHIKLINEAAAIGSKLIVGLNSDAWLVRKKDVAFMPLSERKIIVEAIRGVDEVLDYNDDDNTSCSLLEKVKQMYPDEKITFANGGDRTELNIPELDVHGVSFIFGVGGDYKSNSSSKILHDYAKRKK